jgi:hypothetical protein
VDKLLVFLTGVPGSGKSKVGERLEKRLGHLGRTTFLDDYFFLKVWANQLAESRPDWVELIEGGENFNIKPPGYVPMSHWVAEALAKQVAQLFQDHEIVLVEMARGVGEPRAEYGRDAVKPMVEWLHDLGVHDLEVANFELRGEAELLRERLKKRFEENKKAAAPPVLDKYLDEWGKPLSSSVWELGRVPGLVSLNRAFINGQSEPGITDEVHLDRLANQVMGEIEKHFFGSLFEGQPGRSVEQG